MKSKKPLLIAVVGIVISAILGIVSRADLFRDDARRQLDQALAQRNRIIYGEFLLRVEAAVPAEQEGILPRAIEKVITIVKASEAEYQRFQADLGGSGKLQSALFPFRIEAVEGLRRSWQAGILERLTLERVGQGVPTVGVKIHGAVKESKTKSYCYDYEIGNIGCYYAIARWRVEKITGIRSGLERGVPAKILEFDAISEPTDDGRLYADQKPDKGSFIAAFVEYDDGWRLAVGPFQKF